MRMKINPLHAPSTLKGTCFISSAWVRKTTLHCTECGDEPVYEFFWECSEVKLIILREAELERINHGAKCTACSDPVYYANNHDWSSRGGRKLREMIYERRNVRRARGFNDSIYVNDNTPSLSAVSRLPLLLFSFLLFYFFLSASFLLLFFFTFTATRSGPRCCERTASSPVRPRSRKWQMKFRAPPPSRRGKKIDNPEITFFSDSARRIILSTCVIPVTIIILPSLPICSNALTSSRERQLIYRAESHYLNRVLQIRERNENRVSEHHSGRRNVWILFRLFRKHST